MAQSQQFGFKDLLVWQKAVEFAKLAILVIDKIPFDRKHFRIMEQLENAAFSISSNVAEGKGRYSKKEFKQFLYIARGSLYETISILNVLAELGWLDRETLEKLEAKGLELNKMLNGLISSILTT